MKNANAAEPLKIALVGAGGRGTEAVSNAMQANDKVELVAIGDVFESHIKGALDRFAKNENLKNNIKVGDNKFVGLDAYKKVLDQKFDYVILATPPGWRSFHFEYAVEKGHNVFCEKPVATDAPGIRRFLAAAKKSEEQKLHVVTGNQRRHEKPYVETIKKIHDGALGEIVAGRAYWDGTLPHCREREAGMTDIEYQLYNWYNFCWICGDNIVEQHLHNLDVMNWVFKSHPFPLSPAVAVPGNPKKKNMGIFGIISLVIMNIPTAFMS